MNEERKYSDNNIFANNGVDDNNQNNITPNNESLQINQSILESTTSLPNQEPNNDINQNITNDLIFDTSPSVNNTIGQQLDTINNSENNKSLNSQDLNSKPLENLPPTNQPNTNNNYNFESEKKPKKNNILPITIIAVILIIIGGVIVCKALPMFQNKFKVMINETFKYLNSNIKDNENVTGNMTLKMTSTSNVPELKNLEKIGFSANYAIDYKNKLLNLNIKSNFFNDSLLNASIYGQSKTIYTTLDELYDKTIEMPLGEDYDKIFTQNDNQKELKIVLKSINKALNNALKENYFTKGKDTVNGKKVDTTILTINKDNYQTIKEDIINTLLKDKNFLESTAKISDMSTNEIEDSLKKVLDEKEKIAEEIKLTIYTKGTNFVKFEAKSSDTNISITGSKDQYEYTLNNGEVNITGTFKINTNKDETSTSLTMEYNEVLIELDTTSKKGANITKKDISNTINYEEMTTEDLTGIFFNLMKNKGLTKFMEDFNLNNSTLEDDYDDDWSLNDDDSPFTNGNL